MLLQLKHFLVPMVSSGDVSKSDKKRIYFLRYEILKMSCRIVRMHFMTSFVVFLVVSSCSGELIRQTFKYFEIFQFSTHVNILHYTDKVLKFSWLIKYRNRWKKLKQTSDNNIFLYIWPDLSFLCCFKTLIHL